MKTLLLAAMALTSCLPLGCSSSGQLNPETACKLRALTTLPEDLESVSVRDVVRITRAVRECSAIEREFPSPDAGKL